MNPNGRRKGIPRNAVDDAKQNKFLTAYAKIGIITQAAKVAGVDRSSHHHWKNDPNYLERFEAAHAEAVDRAEDELRKRGSELTEYEVIYEDGVEKKKVLRRSDPCLIFYLKGNRPEKYKDRWFSPDDGSAGMTERKLMFEEVIKDGEARRALVLLERRISGVPLAGGNGETRDSG